MLSSSSCARSVVDIGNHGLPSLSVVSSPDELVDGRFFSCCEIIQTVCILCVVVLYFCYIFPLDICFSSPSALFICPKNCNLFLMFWVGIFCIQPFPLLLRLTSFQSMVFSFFFWCIPFLLLQVFFLGLLSMSSIHIHTDRRTICRLSEDWFWCKLWYFYWWRWTSSCWMLLRYSFLYFCVVSGIWIYCEAQVFKGDYLFYSFLFAKNITHRNVWLFWDDHALSLLCIQLKIFVFTFDCDWYKDVLQFFLRVGD